MVYNEIISVFEFYLGPAAERFVRRQIDMHIKKDPEDLAKKDVAKLSHVSGKALKLLTNNDNIEAEIEKKLSVIT